METLEEWIERKDEALELLAVQTKKLNMHQFLRWVLLYAALAADMLVGLRMALELIANAENHGHRRPSGLSWLPRS